MTAPTRDDDVPSPIDLRAASDAEAWVAAADRTRPWRRDLRAAIAALVGELAPPRRVLELGPGPGLLAEAILAACPVERYTLLDFSPPMLDMSRQRLAGHPAVGFVLADFRRPDWTAALAPPFDAVVAMQAVHEIRHKRHMPRLYVQIHDLLRPGGLLAICDHTPDGTGMDPALHATVEEQHAALAGAGFERIATPRIAHSLYLCAAHRSDPR